MGKTQWFIMFDLLGHQQDGAYKTGPLATQKDAAYGQVDGPPKLTWHLVGLAVVEYAHAPFWRLCLFGVHVLGVWGGWGGVSGEREGREGVSILRG